MYKHNTQRGFIMLIPTTVICMAVLYAAYAVIFKVRNIEHSFMRRESYAIEQLELMNCEQLKSLYISFDPLYLIDC